MAVQQCGELPATLRWSSRLLTRAANAPCSTSAEHYNVQGRRGRSSSHQSLIPGVRQDVPRSQSYLLSHDNPPVSSTYQLLSCSATHLRLLDLEIPLLFLHLDSFEPGEYLPCHLVFVAILQPYHPEDGVVTTVAHRQMPIVSKRWTTHCTIKTYHQPCNSSKVAQGWPTASRQA